MRGEARLISSAISSWAKIGPCMKRKARLPPDASSSTSEPRMSDGIRSGVNCTRGVEAEHDAERLDELGLGEARHADQQAVAARQQRDQGAVDDAFLAEDDGMNRAARRLDQGCRRFRPMRMIASSRLVAVCRSRSSSSPLCRRARRVMQHPGRSWRNGGHRPLADDARHGNVGPAHYRGKLGRRTPQDERRHPLFPPPATKPREDGMTPARSRRADQGRPSRPRRGACPPCICGTRPSAAISTCASPPTAPGTT